MFDAADAQFSFFQPMEWAEKIQRHRESLIEVGEISETLAEQLDAREVIELYYGEEIFVDEFFVERNKDYMMYFEQEMNDLNLFTLHEWADVLQELAEEDADMDQIFYAPLIV
jgi:hypothetical protein